MRNLTRPVVVGEDLPAGRQGQTMAIILGVVCEDTMHGDNTLGGL
jgi:hypothetical protein